MIISILLAFILGVLVGLKFGCESVAHTFYDSNLINYEEFEYMRSWKYFFEIFFKL